MLRTLIVTSRPSRRTERPCRRWAPGTLTLIVTESRAWAGARARGDGGDAGSGDELEGEKDGEAQSATIATIRKR